MSARPTPGKTSSTVDIFVRSFEIQESHTCETMQFSVNRGINTDLPVLSTLLAFWIFYSTDMYTACRINKDRHAKYTFIIYV